MAYNTNTKIIDGITISNTPSAGQIVTATSSATANWATGSTNIIPQANRNILQFSATYSVYNAAPGSISAPAGNFSVGSNFFIMQTGLTVQGVFTYWAGSATPLNGSSWNPTTSTSVP